MCRLGDDGHWIITSMLVGSERLWPMSRMGSICGNLFEWIWVWSDFVLLGVM